MHSKFRDLRTSHLRNMKDLQLAEERKEEYAERYNHKKD